MTFPTRWLRSSSRLRGNRGCPDCWRSRHSFHCNAPKRTGRPACGRAVASAPVGGGNKDSKLSVLPGWLGANPSNALKPAWDSWHRRANSHNRAGLGRSYCRPRVASQSFCVSRLQFFGNSSPTLPVWHQFGKARRPPRYFPALRVDFSDGKIKSSPANTLLDWLANALVECRHRLGNCEREGCKTPYFMKSHPRGRYCSEACFRESRREKKNQWWKQNPGMGAKPEVGKPTRKTSKKFGKGERR